MCHGRQAILPAFKQSAYTFSTCSCATTSAKGVGGNSEKATEGAGANMARKGRAYRKRLYPEAPQVWR